VGGDSERLPEELSVVIVKLGGGRTLNVEGMARDLAGLDERAILVHGANALRDELAEKLGVTRRTIVSASGYESVFTDESTIDLQLMAYAGLRNKRVVEALLMAGVRAVGLTGLDGGVIRGRRNPGIRSREGDRVLIRRDLSGKPSSVNEPLLRSLMDAGYTPVLTVPIADENGCAINTENDDVVALLQGVFKATTVIQLIEAPGFLADPGDPGSVIPRLSPAEVAVWKDRVPGRIKRKLHAIGKLLASEPARIVLADGRVEHPLREALAGKGTVIQ
jgi:acetylglutamate/LysW-gamma-L-alpha-aminoadipate kinase